MPPEDWAGGVKTFLFLGRWFEVLTITGVIRLFDSCMGVEFSDF